MAKIHYVKEPPDLVELQAENNGTKPAGKFAELGTPGLSIYAGLLTEAYSRELYWPTVAPLYDRLWRSDPEVSVVRLMWESWASGQSVEVEIPDTMNGEEAEPPSDDDKKARDFVYEVLDDIEGGVNQWFTTCITRVPFYGWGWWEVVPGLRKEGWRPPGQDDPWRSDYDDGLIGYRRLASRRYSAFDHWDVDDETGRLKGMYQMDPPRPVIDLPIERSLHVTFGDHDNPEGLATFEALWRLERYKYGLELIQGMGYEHAAGHAEFKVEEAKGQLTTEEKNIIRSAARAIATASEGNYIALPGGFTFRMVDVPFAAGSTILAAIQHYSILKLAIWGMQWISIASLAGTGSYAAMSDSSTMALTIYNSMADGFVSQADEQIVRRLFDYKVNKDAFPGMTRRPRLKVTHIEKQVPLAELGAFFQAMSAVMPIGEEDWIAVRRATKGLLPETMPQAYIEKKEAGELEPKPTEPAEPTEEEAGKSIAKGGGPEEPAEEPVEEPSEMELELRLLQDDTEGGVMVALFVPVDIASRLALSIDGALPPQDIHLTLAYLGTVEQQPADQGALKRVVERFSQGMQPIKGRIAGLGRFVAGKDSKGKHVVYASYDAPNLPAMREQLVRYLSGAGFFVYRTHGFTPHITLAYVNPKAKQPAMVGEVWGSELTFDKIGYAWGSEREEFQADGLPRIEMSVSRPFVVGRDELPTDVTHLADDPLERLGSVVTRFLKWADEHDPELAMFMRAEVLNEKEG